MIDSCTRIFTIKKLKRTFILTISSQNNIDFAEIEEIIFDEEGNVFIIPINHSDKDIIISYIQETIGGDISCAV